MFKITFMLLVTIAVSAQANFISDNVLEVTGMGKSAKKGSPTFQSANCKEAARGNAMMLAIEALAEKGWSMVTNATVTREAYGSMVTTTVQGTIRGGRSTASSFDDSGELNVCTVTIQYKNIDLQKMNERILKK